MLRIGIVQSVDIAAKTVTVRWPDTGVVSGALYVLRTDTAWMPAVGDPVLVGFLDGPDADGIVLGVVQ